MAVQLTGYVNAPDQPESATAVPAATLTSGIDASTTTIPVSSVTCLPPSDKQFVILIGTEKMLHTSRSGLNLTVTRGVEGTIAASHSSGANVWNPVTAASDARNPGPMTAAGDFVYLDANGAPTRLAAPSNGDYSLRWTSSVPSYVAVPSATVPGGLTTQIQFNNAGAFGGSAEFTWGATHSSVSIGTTDPADFWGSPFNYKLNVGSDITLPSDGSDYALINVTPVLTTNTHNAPDSLFGLNMEWTIQGTGNIGLVMALDMEAYYSGTGNITTFVGVVAVPHLLTAGGSATKAVGLWGSVEVLTGTSVTNAYYAYLPNYNGGGTITNLYGVWVDAVGGSATNPYSFWSDEQGVYRIRSDNTFNSVYQAITALYNPQFTKYIAGAGNHERIVQQWESNVATIRTEAGGTGTLRSINLAGATVQLNGQAVTLSGNLTTTGSFNPTFAIPSSSTWTFPSGGGALFAFVQGASVADATDAPSAITQLNALISRVEALGLIATV